MKTTLELPDDLIVRVKVEAAHQHRKLNELVPELLEIGLQHQHDYGSSASAVRERSVDWLTQWRKLGRALDGASSGKSAVEQLEADRGARG